MTQCTQYLQRSYGVLSPHKEVLIDVYTRAIVYVWIDLNALWPWLRNTISCTTCTHNTYAVISITACGFLLTHTVALGRELGIRLIIYILIIWSPTYWWQSRRNLHRHKAKPWYTYKQRKTLMIPLQTVPWFQCKHADNGNESAILENKNNKGGVPQIIEGRANLCSSSLQVNRQD